MSVEYDVAFYLKNHFNVSGVALKCFAVKPVCPLCFSVLNLSTERRFSLDVKVSVLGLAGFHIHCKAYFSRVVRAAKFTGNHSCRLHGRHRLIFMRYLSKSVGCSMRPGGKRKASTYFLSFAKTRWGQKKT